MPIQRHQKGKRLPKKPLLIKKLTSLFNLIALNNTTNLSNSFSWPNFFEGHHILRQESFDGYMFSVWYKLIQFSLPLNPAIHVHKMDNAAKILCPIPDVENKTSLKPILYFIASSPKLLQFSSSELISLNYSFKIRFKISLKTTNERWNFF